MSSGDTEIEVLTSNKISFWLSYDKNHLGYKYDSESPHFSYNEFPVQYQTKAGPFEVPVYKVDAANCLIFTSKLVDEKLLKHFVSEKIVKFPLHPVNLIVKNVTNLEEIISFDCEKKNLQVVATSSTRTVFPLKQTPVPHLIKLHSNLQITKTRRHMELRKISHAVAITKAFDNSDVFFKNPKIAYYPESLGVVYNTGKKSDWGFLVRELQSRPYLKRDYYIVPLFSFYLAGEDSDPYLVKLIKLSGKDPLQYILKEVLFPLFEGWIEIYYTTGFLLEPHGQNVNVEIDSKTHEIIRFSHKDFDCVFNSDYLKKLGQPLDGLNFDKKDVACYESKTKSPKGTLFSMTYDYAMKKTLDDFARFAEEYYGIKKETLCEEIIQFQKNFEDFFFNEFYKDGIIELKKIDCNYVFLTSKKKNPWRLYSV